MNASAKRKRNRLDGFDYALAGAYFVTICTHERKEIFWSDGQINLAGSTAEKGIRAVQLRFPEVEILSYAIMPNHVHLLLKNAGSEVNLSTIIGSFKREVTKRMRRENPSLHVWQVSFHDRIVRDQEEMDRINAYIELNPVNWKEEHEIPSDLF
jgi:REP element-mobilizing transposase RayT